jgi:peptidyl-prolyl cis-trans isomerase C
MQTTHRTPPRPRVNGILLARENEPLSPESLRQRACTELLRQAAQAEGLLAQDDPVPEEGAISPAAADAIERLLDRMIPQDDPDEEACRRHHAAHASAYAQGERVHARHILFAVTPGVDVAALRQRAEACLLDMRCQNDTAPASADTRFAEAARQWSNCPSAAQGGDLGWLRREDCAPEFARELFGHADQGVLPRLVHSRFGLHVVKILSREAGESGFESVRGAVAQTLRQQRFATALRQYLDTLATQAELRGLDLSPPAERG